MKQDKDLQNAIIENLRLKAKILLGVFSIILIGQLVILVYLLSATDIIGKVIPYKALIIGPLFLLTIIFGEYYFFHRLKVVSIRGASLPQWLPYFVVVIECSFPTAFMMIASQFLTDEHVITIQQLITSPPLLMYIIMIILSSLSLDLRISVFAGLVAGLEYMLVSIHLLHRSFHPSPLDFSNVVFRSGLIFLCGLIAGLISKKIRDAVQSSLEHKNALINKLDQLVAEKTHEITTKNEMLEEKQREITDSMRYAKRIQDSQLPSAKQIQRNLDQLNS